MLTSFTSSTDLPAPRPVAAARPAPAAPRPASFASASSPATTTWSAAWAGSPPASRPAVGSSPSATSSAAALFVVGCIGFYWPTLAAGSVTLFLLGSLLFLVSALGSALLDHRPGHRR